MISTAYPKQKPEALLGMWLESTDKIPLFISTICKRKEKKQFIMVVVWALTAAILQIYMQKKIIKWMTSENQPNGGCVVIRESGNLLA